MSGEGTVSRGDYRNPGTHGQNQGGGCRWGREGGLAGVGWKDGAKRHTIVTE